MLMSLINHGPVTVLWYLYFGLSFVVMMIIPGHILNNKAKKTMFKELDPLLHSQLRLAVMSILLSVEEAEFVYIKEKTNATAGNLSVQLDKLNEAGYIEIEKGFAGKKPRIGLPDHRQRTLGDGGVCEYIKTIILIFSLCHS